ncbi:MAG: PilZ domain-containing protein [Candidatus Saccharicenans sp.]
MSQPQKNIYQLEKRISQRFKIPGATVSYKRTRWFLNKKKFEEEFCPLLDLSRGGLRFGCRRRLRVGKKLYLQLSIPGERSPLFLLGRVRWSAKNDNENFPYQTGVQFNVYGEKKDQNYPGNLVKIISLEQKFIDVDLDLSVPPDEYDIESS